MPLSKDWTPPYMAGDRIIRKSSDGEALWELVEDPVLSEHYWTRNLPVFRARARYLRGYGSTFRVGIVYDVWFEASEEHAAGWHHEDDDDEFSVWVRRVRRSARLNAAK